MNIRLDQYKVSDINIGYIVEDNIQLIRTYVPINVTILLKISNDKLRGIFTVPDAIGFSTPLNMLGPFGPNDILTIYEDIVESNFHERYIQWKLMFNTKIYTKSGNLIESQQPTKLKRKNSFHMIYYKLLKNKDSHPQYERIAIFTAKLHAKHAACILNSGTKKSHNPHPN